MILKESPDANAVTSFIRSRVKILKNTDSTERKNSSENVLQCRADSPCLTCWAASDKNDEFGQAAYKLKNPGRTYFIGNVIPMAAPRVI